MTSCLVFPWKLPSAATDIPIALFTLHLPICLQNTTAEIGMKQRSASGTVFGKKMSYQMTRRSFSGTHPHIDIPMACRFPYGVVRTVLTLIVAQAMVTAAGWLACALMTWPSSMWMRNSLGFVVLAFQRSFCFLCYTHDSHPFCG